MSLLKLVSAGILGIPCFMVAASTAPVLAFFSLPMVWLLLFRRHTDDDEDQKVLPDQVIIAGGSSGIGLGIAKECCRRGVSKITLLARNKARLEEAQAELRELSESLQKNSEIQIVSVSVSDYSALERACQDLKIPADHRVVLWNCAGFAHPQEFLEVPIEKMEEQVRTNQLGSMYLVRAMLPHLRQGCIVLTSSAAGQVGVYGYTTYAPTKYAIRGFAETLHAELIRSHPGISIQLAFPVDTDTPGYQEELKLAPAITRILSESGGVSCPNEIAKKMVSAAFCKHPTFHVYFSLEGWMLSNLTAGMSPVNHLGDAITQVALSGIFRLIGLFVLNDWWNTIRTHPHQENATVKTKKVD